LEAELIFPLQVLYNREKQMHIEATTVLHKKERAVKELIQQSEEDRKNIIILQESLDKLNEKIKMYKRQLEEQESISNSNIMRVKKFQRELEAAEHRAEEAESTLNAFRSRQRVFAAAETRQAEEQRSSVEREVVVKKVVHNVNVSNVSDSRQALAGSSAAYSALTAAGGDSSFSSARGYRAGSTAAERAIAETSSSSSQALRSSGYRAGSVAYSRAGSMARSSMARATSIGRAGSVIRY